MMLSLGVEKVYIDKASGKNMQRPQLQELLSFARCGDVVIVDSISRFARNTKDLLELMEILESRQVSFISKKEAIDTATPTGKFMLTVFAAVAELEREYLLQRQREGIEIAKRAGKCKGKPPIALTAEMQAVFRRYLSGELIAAQAIRQMQISKSTFLPAIAGETNMKNKSVFSVALLLCTILLSVTLKAGRTHRTKPHGFYAEPLKRQ
ncbi:recombinase family protein [Pygmaiobacter massiliensis]|uniref:recombinase family protein n=1 Tax=Pygmaiobacter massiliensis TaxID=1917873 RepID=UPI002896541F|nr:recombinase family protein [Pygmaiobacter massiliensis]